MELLTQGQVVGNVVPNANAKNIFNRARLNIWDNPPDVLSAAWNDIGNGEYKAQAIPGIMSMIRNIYIGDVFELTCLVNAITGSSFTLRIVGAPDDSVAITTTGKQKVTVTATAPGTEIGLENLASDADVVDIVIRQIVKGKG